MSEEVNLAELAARITRLEDLEAIKQLKATYCDVCDDDHNPERMVELFVEDGIWEGKGIARAEGHAEIHALFTRFGAMMSFSQHMVMNPIIDVSGDTARGTWYFFGPFTFTKNNQATWQATRYLEDYVKRDGRWLFRHLQVKGPGFSAPYQKGWAD